MVAQLRRATKTVYPIGLSLYCQMLRKGKWPFVPTKCIKLQLLDFVGDSEITLGLARLPQRCNVQYGFIRRDAQHLIHLVVKKTTDTADADAELNCT